MENILQIEDLHLDIRNGKERTPILRGVNLAVQAGEIHGLIGESGCGKTMLSRAVLDLTEDHSWELRGRILYRGQDLRILPPRQRRRIAGKKISYISQDPVTALNPLYTVGEQIAEMLRYHEGMTRREAKEEAVRQLERVGIRPGREQAQRYPHQFSGGQLQRICIAMAVCCRPDLLLADEPTTALDVTTQAQILELLGHLRDEGLAILLITHDFGVAAQIGHRISVMQEGRIIEEGSARDIFRSPREAYTARLVESARRKEQGYE